jgi:hypothetical protein
VTEATPVPLRLTVCGLFFPVSEIVRLAAREPNADGVTVTDLVQLLPAPSVDGLTGQLLVCVKSDRLDVMLVIVMAVFWPFFSVMFFDALAVP